MYFYCLLAWISAASSARGERRLKALGVNAVRWRHYSQVVIYANFGKTRVFCVCMFRSWPCNYQTFQKNKAVRSTVKFAGNLFRSPPIAMRFAGKPRILPRTYNNSMCHYRKMATSASLVLENFRNIAGLKKTWKSLPKKLKACWETLWRGAQMLWMKVLQFISQSLRSHMSTSQLRNRTRTHRPLHRFLALRHRWRSFLTWAHSWLYLFPFTQALQCKSLKNFPSAKNQQEIHQSQRRP